MLINLNNAFPAPTDPSLKRGPLPKQQAFLNSVLDPTGPKYILYGGGVGSGKTLIGCVTMLTLAVQYPGDYLICRLFNPELKITTYKTFLEICPPELIVENRVADQIVRLRSADGKIANIIFRGLEDYDKHRSLNLNAAYIDEASQVSEGAFVLLQSRLRGPHIRKIFMTTNPNGHSWLYKLFIKKDLPTEAAKKQFFAISAPSTENLHLPSDYVQSMLDTYSPDRIKREVEASWDAFQGQVYTDFSRHTHVIRPFPIPPEWTKFVGADHGFRNPAAWIWCAMDYDNNIYVYKEWYHADHTIPEIVKGSRQLGTGGVVDKNGRDRIEGIWIDPSTRANRGKDSDFQTFLENIPKDWVLIPANNEVETGIDRIKSLLKPDTRTGRPRLQIFDTCTNVIEEMGQYRYQELQPGQESTQNAKETPVKKDDHSCFVAGTLIYTPSGMRPIQDIRAGDLVMTSLGPKPVLVAGKMGLKRVFEYEFTTTKLSCTPDHPILLANGVTKPINQLTPSDTCATIAECEYYLTTSFLGKLATTTERMAHTVERALRPSIEKFGSISKALSLKGTTSITSTGMLTTTPSPTLSVSTESCTYHSTHQPLTPGQTALKLNSISPLSDLSQWSGTKAQKGVNGIGNTLSKWLRRCSNLKKSLSNAFIVGLHSLPMLPQQQEQNTVTRTAKPPRFVGVEEVYNLSVQGVSEFYANDILVSNCDALRYAIMSRPDAPIKADRDKPKREAATLEGSIAREMHSLRNPKIRDPFQDF